jgi:hypothetical protein
VPWMRTGDSAATYPAVMETAGLISADERTVNEVFGFVSRCAIQSAAHKTDYVIDVGTVQMIGGARWRELVNICVAVGLYDVVLAGRSWRLIQDPEFIHIQLKADVEWARQQRNDNRDTRLTVPVRLRDGDQCRWCGVLVQWRGKKTNRSGSLDHLHPGQPGTVDTLVVACARCNGARGANPEAWADVHELRPAPASPRYGRWTAEHLTNNGYPVEPNVASDGDAPTAAADPAPQRVRPAAPGSSAQAPPEVESQSHPRSVRTGSAGTGRDGSGSPTPSPRTSTVPHQPQDQAPRPRRRRGKRGGRSRSTNGGSNP